MANTSIVAHEVTAVEAAANDARALWDAAVIAEQAAWTTGNMQTIRTAQLAQIAAHDAWKAAERALVAHWSAEVAADEELRLEAMCESYETLEYDYADYSEGFLTEPLPYTLTTAGMTYLDRHYATDSDVTMLALDGDSPYGDGTTGWVQPTPAHPCCINGVMDMDALSRYEDLAY